MNTILIAVLVATAVAIAMIILGYVRQARISVDRLISINPGAFRFFAANSIPNPKLTLELLNGIEGRHEISIEKLNLGADKNDQKHKDELSEKQADWISAAGDAAIPAIEVWNKWHSVDEHVFQAFSHLSRQNIEGVADLLSLVEQKDYAIDSASFVSKLLGHVGEWHAQEHLVESGAGVVMPIATNIKGLDLWANDHAINVKTVQDAGQAAASHFKEYPEIPILVPADAIKIPDDALHFDPSNGLDFSLVYGKENLVIVDDALSHASVLQETKNALDVIKDPGVDGHFPYITVAVSSFREAKLLAKGHTDITRALKNVTVDGAAVGGGALLGGKSGAAIGALAGPIGVVAGGVIGSIVGAMGGRLAANSVKQAPLLDAKEKYDTALNFYKHAEYGQTQKAGKEWEAAKDAENMILGERLGVMMQRVSQQLYEIEQQLISTKKISSVQAKMLLKMARHTVAEIIENEEIELHDRIPLVARPWSSLIAPAASKSLSQHKVELEKWDDLVHQVVKNWNDRNEDVENALDLALAVPGGHSIAYEYIRRVQSARVIAVSNAAVANDNAIKESLSLRADSVSKLKSKWNEIITRVEKEIEPAVDMLRTAGLTLKSELQKNGME